MANQEVIAQILTRYNPEFIEQETPLREIIEIARITGASLDSLVTAREKLGLEPMPRHTLKDLLCQGRLGWFDAKTRKKYRLPSPPNLDDRFSSLHQQMDMVAYVNATNKKGEKYPIEVLENEKK